jgi:hypothetical protein
MPRITGRKTWMYAGALAVTAAVAGARDARLDAQTQTQTPPQAQTVQVAPLPPGESFTWVAAQPALAIEADVVFVADGDQPPPPPPPPMPAMAGRPFDLFIGSDGKPVAGAPYSADAVTEMIQTLADGNRIVQRQSASVARDGQGRTRREMALAAIGPMMPEDPPRITFVHDPVAGVSYQFNDTKRTAVRRTLPKWEDLGGGHVTMHVEGGPTAGVAFGGAGVVSYKARTREMVKSQVEAGAMTVHDDRAHEANAQTEALGTQSIEGVDATGTRTTTTIPAGAIGNEQPIKIVSESWYSPALQAIVLTKRSDPRFGETSYKLTNIVRADPPPALFEVPTGYTITDEPDVIKFKISRDQQQPQPEPDR